MKDKKMKDKTKEKINLCEMCQEYAAGEECEYKKTCPLQKLVRKNEKLQKENKKLKEQVDELRSTLSWYRAPDAMGALLIADESETW